MLFCNKQVTNIRVPMRVCCAGVNFYQTQDYIRSFTPKPVSAIEAIMCSLAKNAVDIRPGLIIVFSEAGKSARLIAKYRPCAPVMLVTSNVKLARTCSSLYALTPYLLDAPIQHAEDIQAHVDRALKHAVDTGLCMSGKEVLVMTSTKVAAGDEATCLLKRQSMVTIAPGALDHDALGALAPYTSAQDPKFTAKTVALRSTVIDLDMLTKDHAPVRKTKIIVTIGPSCSSKEVIEKLVDEGMDIARFKFSHGTPQDHAQVLSSLREVCAAKGRSVATMMDLQGPEVRTSYLIDHNTKQRIDKLELTTGDQVRQRQN